MRKTVSAREPGTRRSRILSSFGLMILLALGGWIFLKHQMAAIEPSNAILVHVTIPKGSTVTEIGTQLASEGLVRSRDYFLLAAELSGKSAELQAGTYALSRSMSSEEMINEIAEGRTDTVVVNIPEGFTAEEVADRLASQHLTDKIAFLKVVATEGSNFSFVDGFAPPRNLEGYLYPLTYNFIRNNTPNDLVQQLLDGFDRNIFRKHPEVHDWRPIVIIASLVEREALVDSDRPLIASVYYNRLNIGMPLQCDATVQYALPKHKSRLLFSDLRINSPYNTYLHRGLPPGPICNPGELSIDAALHPAETDYLFYVAGPGGAHVFSRTLAEQDRQIAAIRSKTPSTM